jgi:hypothetical protein
MAVGPGCFSADWAPLAAGGGAPARAWQFCTRVAGWLLGKMESKTLLLDLVQQRKDGRITQEEMVRQLVELRNQVRHTRRARATPLSPATRPAGCEVSAPLFFRPASC